MQFRFDKLERDDFRAVDGNLYLRTHNHWFLFVKNVKGFTFNTEFGEGVFAVTDAEGFRHVFFTSFGVYASLINVEVVVGKYTNAEYVWTSDTLAKYSDTESEKHNDIAQVLEKMNSERRELHSVNKFADNSSYEMGLPDVKVDEAGEELEGDGYY